MKASKIEGSLEKIRKQQHFFKRITLEETLKDTEAYIDLISHDLVINYNPRWIEKNIDNNLKIFLQKKNIPEEKALETMLKDLLFHEIGHRGTIKEPGCPGNFRRYAEKFLNPLCEATGIENKKKLQRLSNMLTDTVNNTIIKQISPDKGLTSLTGLYLYFKGQGNKIGKFSRLYEAHTRLNLFLNGDKPSKRLLREYFTHNTEINEAIGNFLQRTGISGMKTVVMQGSKKIEAKDMESIRDYLRNMENWERISRIYGEEFGKLMEKNEQQPLFGSGGPGSSDDADDSGSSEGSGKNDNGGADKDNDLENGGSSGSGNGSEDLGKFDPFECPGCGNDLEDLGKFDPSDGFGEELNRKEGKKAVVRRGMKAGNGPGWMTNFEYLESLYEILASDKVFELSVPPMKSKSYPLIGIGDREFDFEEDAVSDISGMGFEDGAMNLDFMVARYKYQIDANVKKGIVEKPDFVIAMLDTSSSMQEQMPEGPGLGEAVNPKAPEDLQWRFNSRYHVSLITYFMGEQRFRDLGVNDADVYFVNFSYDTIISQGSSNSRKDSLSPQFGGTTLDLPKVEPYIGRENSLIMTISDGEIRNYGAIARKMGEIAEHNPVVHVQIGPESDFSSALEKAGVLVKKVKKEEDLYDFIIDLTDRFYGDGK